MEGAEEWVRVEVRDKETSEGVKRYSAEMEESVGQSEEERDGRRDLG